MPLTARDLSDLTSMAIDEFKALPVGFRLQGMDRPATAEEMTKIAIFLASARIMGRLKLLTGDVSNDDLVGVGRPDFSSVFEGS
jgi:hypothetical protein